MKTLFSFLLSAVLTILIVLMAAINLMAAPQPASPRETPKGDCALEFSQVTPMPPHVDIFFAKIGQDYVFFMIPFDQLTDTKFIASGVSAGIKEIPNVQILGRGIYKMAGDGEKGHYIPLSVNELASEKEGQEPVQKIKSDAELNAIVKMFYTSVPGLTVDFRRPEPEVVQPRPRRSRLPN